MAKAPPTAECVPCDNMKYRNIMNHKPLRIAFLVTTPFVVRCKTSSQQSATQARDTTAQQFGEMRPEPKEAAQEMAHGFHQTRQRMNYNLAE